MRRLMRVLAVTCLAVAPFGAGNVQAEGQQLHIYAGGGLKKALDPIVAKFQVPGVTPLVNYGPSGGLYAQIAQGQPCDIYFSADWRYVVCDKTMGTNGVGRY